MFTVYEGANMDKVENIVKHAEVSEKAIERYLCDQVRDLGGVCLKYSNANMIGYPDRIALMPAGKVFWVELKSKSRKRSKLQEIRCAQLARLGFDVFTCDSKDSVNEALKSLGYAV